MPGEECLRRPDQQPSTLELSAEKDLILTTNNLNRFLLAVQASFLPGKTELFNYLSSNKTKLKSFVLELVCFTGRKHLVTSC